MKVFFAGDVVGKPGRRAIQNLYPVLKEKYDFDLFIANGENAAGGSGITSEIAEDLYGFGVDVITTGDHIWKQKEILNTIDKNRFLLRPANYPPGTPGLGSTIFETRNGDKIGIINLQGRIFMSTVDCPFRKAETEVERLSSITKTIIVDMHAEATSEKLAMGRFLDGKVSAVVGTHTHIQTADETILPGGTAYITDLGMTGPHESILGREIEPVLKRFITQMPSYFRVAKDDIRLSGALITIDAQTGKAAGIERIQIRLDEV